MQIWVKTVDDADFVQTFTVTSGLSVSLRDAIVSALLNFAVSQSASGTIVQIRDVTGIIVLGTITRVN